jgi:PAS domain S-box-containing protein
MGFEKYSKAELIKELNKLKEELNREKQEKEEFHRKLSEQEVHLKERNKELGGIYQITQLINDPGRSVDSVLQESIKTLANSFLYPDISSGRLFWNNKSFTTEDFKETRWKQRVKIDLSHNQGYLIIEICYLEEMPELDEGPFLKEERHLLNTIARELAVYLDRKYAEKQTSLNAQKFESVFNSVQDAIFIHDFKGNFLEANEEACKRLNYSREELFSLTPMDVDEKSHAEKAPGILKHLKEHNRYKGETIHIAKDGRRIPTELNSTKILFEGKPAILTVARDITKRKEYEKELLDAKNKAEESDNLKSAFLANLSHEIRTPLNAIIGFTDLLNDNDLDERKKKEFLSTIRKSGNKLLSIINDILDVSFIESDQVQISNQEFSMNEFLDEISLNTPFEIDAYNKDIELKTSKPLPKDQDVIVSDPKIIRQIYDKLIDNALKFTEKGYIEIGYKAEGKEKVAFYISDTGIGVPDESKDLIFERFRQLDNGITRQYEGLGLGLSIAKGLVNRLKGSIEFHSKEGEGSTVIFKVPARFSQEHLYKKTEKDVLPDLLPGRTILIAEDDITNYFLIEEFLSGTKAQIKHAENGSRALEMCRKGEIDLILMDIKMPVLDGIEAFKEIKKIDTNIPVIALTAYAYENDKKRLLNQGFDGYLSKPVDQEELIQMVEEVMSREKN